MMQNETDHKLWREGKGWHSQIQSGDPDKLAQPAIKYEAGSSEIPGYLSWEGEPYTFKPLSACRVKCCAWENSRLDREYRNEIGSRKKLLGSLRWGRLRALVIGWAIAKGQDPDDAKRFATHIQYH